MIPPIFFALVIGFLSLISKTSIGRGNGSNSGGRGNGSNSGGGCGGGGCGGCGGGD